MNVVDSSGWLEYFANGKNADFFAAAIVRHHPCYRRSQMGQFDHARGIIRGEVDEITFFLASHQNFQ